MPVVKPSPLASPCSRCLGAPVMVLLGGALLLAATPAAGQEGRAMYERGRQHWEETRYGRAFPELREYRRAYQGRTAFVDYMIGTSACRIEDRKQFGFRALDWLLYSYPLSEQGRSVVKTERDVCLQSVLDSASQVELAQMISAGVTGRGKTFHWAGRNPIGAYPVRRTKEIPRSEFLARIVPTGDAEGAARAMAAAGERLDTANLVSSNGFAIASKGPRSAKELETLSQLLDRFMEFQIRTYGLARPPALITVYLTQTIEELQDLASRIHGLDVSPSTIGYSFADDMSVVAVTPRALYGTLLHELTHLLIRGNFGDAPQWIDEGVASLYEVSTEHKGTWLGEDNWRGNVLREYRTRWPTLDDVVTSPWFAFDDPEHALSEMEAPSAIDQAVLTAYNRFFILYLQERGQLSAVFATVRSQGLGEPETDWKSPGGDAPGMSERYAVHLVEKTLDKELEALDEDFRSWLEPVLENGLNRSPAETARILAQLRPDDSRPSEPSAAGQRSSSVEDAPTSSPES